MLRCQKRDGLIKVECGVSGEGRNRGKEGGRHPSIYSQAALTNPCQLATGKISSCESPHSSRRSGVTVEGSSEAGLRKMLVLSPGPASRSPALDCGGTFRANPSKPGTTRKPSSSSTTSATQLGIATMVLSVQAACNTAPVSGVPRQDLVLALLRYHGAAPPAVLAR